ncbi:MAG: TolC family protein [Saprospiraceae bacterium]|nr:TolC family protein [Saprospiraceae bacterium]
MRSFSLIWLSLTLILNVGAQDVMTLEKCYAIALENSFQIKIDEASIRIAENNDSWALTGKYPTIDLNGSFNANLISDNNRASFLQGTYATAGVGPSLDFSWLVMDGGRVGILKEQLSKIAEQSIYAAQTNSQDLLRNVAEAYHLVLLEQERSTVLQQIFALSRDRLEYEKARREFGVSSSFQQLQFEEAVMTDSTNMVRQTQAEEAAKRNLNALLMIDLESDFAFLDRLSVSPERIDGEMLAATLRQDNPTLKTLLAARELSNINARTEELRRKPSIALGATLGWTENYFKFFGENPTTGDDIKGIFSNRFNIGVNANFNWNVYDGGASKRIIESARMEEELSELDLMQAEADLLNQLHIIIKNYEDQVDLLQLTDRQIAISRANLEIAEERFRLGQINSFDYRTVQNQYLNVALTKVDAIFAVIRTKINLDWLVGSFGDFTK